MRAKKPRALRVEGRVLPAGATHVGTVKVCGVRVPIIRATPDVAPALLDGDNTIDGTFDAPTTTVWIRAGQSETQEKDTIAHELAHAFIALSGLGKLLEATTIWPKGYDDLEEVLVRVAAPHLHGIVEGVLP